ncbi:MAG: hypothetical protein ACRDLF_00340 [Solirubrobacteraceae bacterium]
MAWEQRDHSLFSRGDLRATLENVTQRIVEDVEQTPEDHLLHADEEEWVAALVERRRLDAPELGEPSMDPAEEIQVDVSRETQSRLILDPSTPTYMPGYRVTVHIPFTGDGAIFMLRPSTFSLSPPRAEVGQGELLDVVEYPHDRPVGIRARTERLIQEVESNLRHAQGDIDQYNQTLERKAREAITQRRARIKRNYEHLQATGLPVRSSGESATTYIADAIVRRPAPVLPSTPTSAPVALEPVLGTEVFEHILGVIRSVGLDMERSPKTYSAMGEEDLRQVILTALNPHYRGQTTAEAFNFQGKTDLLIRHENRNLFIAECKFWNGPKGFSETIDQLFGYAAWRDTKLAVVMFVREKNLTSIVEKAQETLAGHERFVELSESVSETELRAKMSWLGDEQRHADLNVFFVSVPTDAN